MVLESCWKNSFSPLKEQCLPFSHRFCSKAAESCENGYYGNPDTQVKYLLGSEKRDIEPSSLKRSTTFTVRKTWAVLVDWDLYSNIYTYFFLLIVLQQTDLFDHLAQENVSRIWKSQVGGDQTQVSNPWIQSYR